MAKIGKEIREIEVVPLEEPDPTSVPSEPSPSPSEPIREPEKTPA
jgi:hypothetical protein